MYKVPAKFKRSIINELKKYHPLIINLQARGKASSEDDARILLNDILSDVLGYDKYNELRTEMREKNNRFDYVLKLNEGPNARKADKFDFVIEAKAAYVKLKQNHIDQTLTYCLTKGMDYFLLTNAVVWQLYTVKRQKSGPEAVLLHEIDFGKSNDLDSLAEEFYLFSKASYLNGDWKNVKMHQKATKVEDVVAVLLSSKIVRAVAKELSNQSGVKVHQDHIKDVIENQVIKSTVEEINKKLLKKINEKPKRKSKEKIKENTAQDIPEEAA